MSDQNKNSLTVHPRTGEVVVVLVVEVVVVVVVVEVVVNALRLASSVAHVLFFSDQFKSFKNDLLGRACTGIRCLHSPFYSCSRICLEC